MSQKRNRPEENGSGSGSSEQQQKRKPNIKNTVMEALFWSLLEPLLRRVVKEEVEHVLALIPESSRNPRDEARMSAGSGLQLRFVNRLPGTIFTSSRIEAEDGNPMQVVLYDSSSQTPVFAGHLSAAKVEIFVLNGEFGSDDQEDWTEADFNAAILREREGKRPLITGELTLSLRNGVGSLGEIMFTDNSSWLRSRKFRLGARLVQRNPGEERVREARSQPFIVKDHRGEGYKKHHPPSLQDEIWRLERIAKDGAFHKRLAAFGITTVQDFLRRYQTDPSTLRNMFGGKQERIWENIIAHASTCTIDDNTIYAYHSLEDGASLFFDTVFKLIGASFNGRPYCSLQELDPSHKNFVENLKQRAYQNISEWVPLRDEPAGGLPMPNVLDFHEFAFLDGHQDAI